jgi:two-component system, chemotaxis family, response regulator Rcp1
MRPVEVLMVEDSTTDVLLTREALRDTGVPNCLHIVDNGEDAMLYLRRQAPFQNAVRPDVILLDLNLPRKSGQEVLAEIKEDLDLRLIPVVVLTTSRAEEDIVRAYSYYANCYVPKPLDFAQFGEVLRSIEHFWLKVATLPPSPPRIPS